MRPTDFLFRPPVIAHRGVPSEAPENTIAAFSAAVDHGCTWVETDVKITHDGVPILFHDELLERTTNGKGSVSDINWADLKELDAGSWFDKKFSDQRILHLSEALRFMLDHGIRPNLEIKPCTGRTQATVMVALIEAAKIWPDNTAPPLISSFDIEALIIATQLHPDWPRGLLLDVWRDDWQDLVHTAGASTINLNASVLTQERVDKLIHSGLPLLAYTVNDPARAQELLHWGVSAVFSDNPKKIIKSL